MTARQPMWMISIGHLLGITSICLGIYLVATNVVSAWWFLLWLPTHLFGSLMTTVGLHRYFSHGAFKTSKFWHNVMGIYSVMLLNGSPYGWSTAHIAHHIYSDTDNDPHLVNWHYLIWKKYKMVRMPKRRLRYLIGDPVLDFVHRYGMVMWVVAVTILALFSWKVLLFGYLMALGSVHLIGGIHQVTSHIGGGPRNLPWMEFILPACGEWHHLTHHEKQSASDLRSKWWHLDLGALFIKAIRAN